MDIYIHACIRCYARVQFQWVTMAAAEIKKYEGVGRSVDADVCMYADRYRCGLVYFWGWVCVCLDCHVICIATLMLRRVRRRSMSF